MSRASLVPILAAALALAAPSHPSHAQVQPVRTATTSASLPKSPLHQAPRALVDSRLASAHGPVDVWLTLADAPVAQLRAEQARAAAPVDPASAREQRKAWRARLAAMQEFIGAQLLGFGSTELGRVQVSHNGIAVRVDAKRLPEIARVAGVVNISPVTHYKLARAEGSSGSSPVTLNPTAYDGKGVRVAILDSGIDYTHAHLGGNGSLETYRRAVALQSATSPAALRGLFPTGKVVGGWDFVGDSWPTTSSVPTPDANPIDIQGHGTHVADIAAGRNAHGAHRGVAPGASLLAIKVCSSTATSCNGVALMQGIDYALDPNGDGSMDDHVDVINLSLGSEFGVMNLLTQAAQRAVDAGVVVVASSGNSGNVPFITGAPGVAPGVLSVAQTLEPGARRVPLVVRSRSAVAGTYWNVAALDFAPVDRSVQAPVVAVGTGCPANSMWPGSPADAYLSSPAGKIALIDRGSCAISLKIDAAARAGALGVLIALTEPGDAITFSLGGGSVFVPTLVIQLDLADRLKAAASATALLSPDQAALEDGSMASTSSRGPSPLKAQIKPEIGAPGATVSALAGSGTRTEPFGGTSGAAPVVAGAAALLLQASPQLSPLEVKSLLMNSSETTVYTDKLISPGELAPISRMGAGELRLDRALALRSVAYSHSQESAALGFGFLDIADPQTITETVTVKNLSRFARGYRIDTMFRDAKSAAQGAVSISASPASFRLEGGQTQNIRVTLSIDPRRLPAWQLNAAVTGGDGPLFNTVEYGGHLKIVSDGDTLAVPWNVVPRPASSLTARRGPGPNTVRLTNRSALPGRAEVFALIGDSPRLPPQTPQQDVEQGPRTDIRAIGARSVTIDGAPYLQVAINTYERRMLPGMPTIWLVFVDLDGDGRGEFVGYTWPGSPSGSVDFFAYSTDTFENLTVPPADIDHESGNLIVSLPMNEMGITPQTRVQISVSAEDTMFNLLTRDYVFGMSVTPDALRFTSSASGAKVPAFSSVDLGYTVNSANAAASPAQKGLLLMHRRGTGLQADVIRLD